MKVLIADAEPVYRTALVTVLSDEAGLTCSCGAGDVDGSLEVVLLHRPEVIVVDARLPGGGPSVLAENLTASGWRGCFVVVATVVTPAMRALAAEIGAPVVAKDDWKGLLAAVRSAVG